MKCLNLVVGVKIMAKTIKSMIDEAEAKKHLWNDISLDKQALKDRDKTKEEAVVLANYFEGRADAFYEALMEIRKI